MTKMIKLSLVAAVAVAGLTTTASAKQNLAEWAQATTLSGFVRYRLVNDMETDLKGDTTEEAKAVMKFTTPVNDAVTANLKYVSEALTNKANVVADTKVAEANFVVKAAGATVIAGLQTSQSPFFANNGDTRSHGFTALVPVSGVTVAAAYYTTSVAAGMAGANTYLAENVTALGVLGKADIVSYGLWYATAQDSADVEDQALAGSGLSGISSYSVDVKAKVAGLNVQVMKTQITTDQTNDTGVTKLVVSGKTGKIKYVAAYAMSNEDGGMTAFDTDTDAKSDLAMHNLSMAKTTDASAFLVGATVPVMDKVSIDAKYLVGSEGDKGNDESFSELDITAKYAMSKNFYAYARYYTGEHNKVDLSGTRIEIKYSF